MVASINSNGKESDTRPAPRGNPAWTLDQTDVFFLRGAENPAYLSLLLMIAGDIETNPGPNRNRHNRNRRRQLRNETPSQLRILQINANGLRARLTELEKLGEDSNADVIAIQESNLTNKTRTPKIKNFIAINRKDRTHTRVGRRDTPHGGVIVYIRKDGGWRHEITEVPRILEESETIEFNAIQLTRIDKKATFKLLNIYVPPTRTGVNDNRRDPFAEPFLPTGRDWIIVGDFNCHSGEWDHETEDDNRGTTLAGWLDNSNLHVLNDGTPTRRGYDTGKTSTPDISLCSHNIIMRTDWKVLDSIGSDHLPIQIDIRTRRQWKRINQRHRLCVKKSNWARFNEVVTFKLEEWEEEPPRNIKLAESQFTAAIREASNTAIPQGARIRPGKAWWSADIDDLIRRRNTARKTAHVSNESKETWKNLSKEVKTTIKKKKRETWRAFVETLDNGKSPKDVSRTIKSMDGEKGGADFTTTMKHEGRTYVSDKEKAKLFIRHYAKISKLPSDKTRDTEMRIKVNERLKAPCTECNNNRHGVCGEFTEAELGSALRRLPKGKASGPDSIVNEMLQNLDTYGKKCLLLLINLSWKQQKVPHAWKRATIIPIPKSGKDLSKCDGYRPISLTQTTAKLLERMVRERMTYLLESRGIICPEQAGFRRGRNTEEQVARISQEIMDGLQKGLRSVLCTVDFTKAYDRVWKSGLLFKMLESGLPQCMVAWTKQFLTSRYADVRFRDGTSDQRVMKEGLPQGSVLAPTLWLIYINDISRRWAEIIASLYADDTAMLSRSKKPTEAAANIQRALDSLYDWCREWKVEVSTSKTECMLATLDPRESKGKVRLNLHFGGTPLKQVTAVRFLGVILDEGMRFTPQAEAAAKAMTARINVFRNLAGKRWGQKSEDLRGIYKQYVRPAGEYAMGVWGSFCAKSTLNKVQTVTNRAARIITGCLNSTPLPALLQESQLEKVEDRVQTLAAVGHERALRQSEAPIKETATRPVRERLVAHGTGGSKRGTWRTTAMRVTGQCNLDRWPRETIPRAPTVPPWKWSSNHKFRTSLKAECRRTEEDPIRRRKAEETIKSYNCDIVAYSDGSVSNTGSGGGGFILKERNDQEAYHKSVTAGGLADSCLAECKAIEGTLTTLLGITTWTTAVIFTDSKAAIEKIRSGPGNQNDEVGNNIWASLTTLSQRNQQVTLQWIPSHCGVEGNERADRLAAEGASMEQSEVPLPLRIAKARIKKWAKERHVPILADNVIVGRGRPPEQRGRGIEVAARQLRTEHSFLLRSYRHRVGEATADVCEECNGSPETATHLLCECPRWNNLRAKCFGGHTYTKEEILTHPMLGTFLRGTGRHI